MYKAYRNRPLNQKQQKFNTLISKSRWVVERTFGSLKRWFDSGTTRLKGLAKTHGLHVLEAIAYNLKPSPDVSNSEKLRKMGQKEALMRVNERKKMKK